MSANIKSSRLVDIDTSNPVWDRFFTVAPLVLIGTNDPNGSPDFAPKHMVTPMGWQNYFGFVCAPTHSTCSNIDRTGEFTVSFPKPSQILYTSLAASPRIDGCKPVLNYFETFPASAHREVPDRFFSSSGGSWGPEAVNALPIAPPEFWRASRFPTSPYQACESVPGSQARSSVTVG